MTNRKGFTLIELLIVLIVLAVISAVVYGISKNIFTERMQEIKVVKQLPAVCQACLNYYKLTGETSFTLTDVSNAGFLPSNLVSLYDISLTINQGNTSSTSSGETGLTVTVRTTNTYSGELTFQGIYVTTGNYYYTQCSTTNPALANQQNAVIWLDTNAKTLGGPGVYPGIP